MKLISLYIENFGGLSRYALNFETGLTTINQPNGFGKTTLAEFIRAMLYGFPRKTKTLEKSRRQRYAPWGGGQYGGNLVFEHEGQHYRIERTFGATPKGDTFALIDLGTNRKSNRFSEEIGMELFGLDSDSFERSAYLPQIRVEGSLSTAAIQAKLSDLVEDSCDVCNYDKAITILRSKRSALIPYRGSGGTVAEAGSMISRLQMQLDQALLNRTQLEVAQKLAAQTQAQIKADQAALAQVRQELAEAAELSAMVSQQRQYQQLRAQHQQASLRAKHYQKVYTMGFPDEETVKHAEAVADRWAILAAQTIRQGKLQFPTQQELDACRRACEVLDAQQLKIRALQSAVAELMQAERQRSATDSNALTGMILAWVVGGLGVAVGAALMLLHKLLYGGIGLGIGTAAVIIAAALTVSRRNQRRTRKKELDEELRAVQREVTTLRESCDRNRRQIEQFLLPYYGKTEPHRFLACLTQLEHDVQMDAQARQRDAEAATCRAELETFFTGLGLGMEQDARAQLRHLREDIRNAQASQTAEKLLAQQLAAIEDACGEALHAELHATADPQQLKAQEQHLRNCLSEQTERLLQTRQQVEILRVKAERVGEIQEELERWQHKQTKDRENVRILDDTMDYLQQAKENLSTSYLGAIRTRFGYYLGQLENSTGESYFIDADFQVQLERMGQARELAYFSAGQADLVMLCMRLALVDALFKGQETLVILDDPFVNLDDVHTAQAQRLLQKLSRERQILYLTCHSSRTLTSK